MGTSKPNAFHKEDSIILNILSALIGSVMFYSNELNNAELYFQAKHDSLTSLANRSAFIEQLSYITSLKTPHAKMAIVLIVDLNGLKKINDTFGHLAGDAAIREAATRLIALTRESDTVARLGGDEFAIIITSNEDETAAFNFQERIRHEFAKPFEFENNPIELSASIGYALYPKDAETSDQLIAVADKRMYSNKKSYYENRNYSNAKEDS